MLILCIKIFLARILDVSLGTIRTILTIKEKKIIASLIGFFEVTVWFLIVNEALMTENSSIWVVFSYAAGFATGTYIGTLISTIFIKGTLNIQIVTDSKILIDKLRENNYAVSVVDAKGKSGKKSLLILEINKNRLAKLESLVYKYDKKPFIIVDDTKYVQNGFIK